MCSILMHVPLQVLGQKKNRGVVGQGVRCDMLDALDATLQHVMTSPSGRPPVESLE